MTPQTGNGPPPFPLAGRPGRSWGTVLLMFFVCLHLAAVLGVLLVVAPRMASAFQQAGVSLPMLTVRVVNLAAALRRRWLEVLPLAAASMVGLMVLAVAHPVRPVKVLAHVLFWLSAAAVLAAGAALLLPYQALLRSLSQ